MAVRIAGEMGTSKAVAGGRTVNLVDASIVDELGREVSTECVLTIAQPAIATSGAAQSFFLNLNWGTGGASFSFRLLNGYSGMRIPIRGSRVTAHVQTPTGAGEVRMAGTLALGTCSPLIVAGAEQTIAAGALFTFEPLAATVNVGGAARVAHPGHHVRRMKIARQTPEPIRISGLSSGDLEVGPGEDCPWIEIVEDLATPDVRNLGAVAINAMVLCELST